MLPTCSVRAFLLAFSALIAMPISGEPLEIGSRSCCEKPPIRPIDKTCLPAGTSPKVVPLYRADVAAKHQQIAYIDSFVAFDNCTDTVQKQLKDLEAKARTTGADALIRVRLLRNRVIGYKENPYTPFFDVMQGESEDYFFRAIAIKYLEPVPEEPEMVPIVVSPQPEVRGRAGDRRRSPFSAGNMLNRGDRRNRRFERVPNVIEAPITDTPGAF